jgi:lysophospholipase L1-like esterase
MAESAAAIAVLGNSITDGRGSGTNKQNRWPDELARRLQENTDTRKVAVLNQGIGGNCVLRDCLGPAAIIDLDAALGDPNDPLRLLPAADTGDHLHPNETGHRMMAEAVDRTLFRRGGN